jgi:hypothetical protein
MGIEYAIDLISTERYYEEMRSTRPEVAHRCFYFHQAVLFVDTGCVKFMRSNESEHEPEQQPGAAAPA